MLVKACKKLLQYVELEPEWASGSECLLFFKNWFKAFLPLFKGPWKWQNLYSDHNTFKHFFSINFRYNYSSHFIHPFNK